MSHYYQRYCITHGEWDHDVDHPGEECPECTAAGEAPSQIEAKRVAALATRLAAMTAWLEANQPDVFRRGIWDAIAGAAAERTADPEPSKWLVCAGCSEKIELPVVNGYARVAHLNWAFTIERGWRCLMCQVASHNE